MPSAIAEFSNARKVVNSFFAVSHNMERIFNAGFSKSALQDEHVILVILNYQHWQSVTFLHVLIVSRVVARASHRGPSQKTDGPALSQLYQTRWATGCGAASGALITSWRVRFPQRDQNCSSKCTRPVAKIYYSWRRGTEGIRRGTESAA